MESLRRGSRSVGPREPIQPTRRRFLCTSLAGSAMFAGCSMLPARELANGALLVSIDGYTQEPFAHDREVRPVYWSAKTGHPVVLMHEIAGLTQETVEFANWLGEHGCRVVMPLLFGAPLQNSHLWMVTAPLLCMRAEFNCLRSGTASPITEWIRALCRRVHAQHGGPGVGLIGMCLTGGFVLSLMADESVIAPVTAQPALPFLNRAGLDADEKTLRRAAARADRAPLLGLRFAEDRVCRDERFAAIEHAFCSSGPCARFKTEVVPGPGHATLTFDYQKALDRGRDPRQRVLKHLRSQFA